MVAIFGIFGCQVRLNSNTPSYRTRIFTLDLCGNRSGGAKPRFSASWGVGSMPDMSWFHWYEFMVLPHRKPFRKKADTQIRIGLKNNGHLSPYFYLQLFSFPLLPLLKPLLIYPHPDTTFVFFGYIFLYLYLVSVYFTHWNIPFCLVYQNVFCFSLAPRSIFVYLTFFQSHVIYFCLPDFSCQYFLITLLFGGHTFYIPHL